MLKKSGKVFLISLMTMTLLNLISCNDDEFISPNNVSRTLAMVSTFNVYYTFRSHSPMPSGTSTVSSIFEGDSLWHPAEITMELKNPSESQFEIVLDWNSRRSFLNFYGSYLEQNDLSFANSYIFTKIHLFGINRYLNTPAGDNTLGITLPYGYNHFGDSALSFYPTVAFVLAGHIDTRYINSTIDIRNKLKEFCTCHELAHARGLISLNAYDYVHVCHKTFENKLDYYCVMNHPWLFLQSPDDYYPPHFCDLHRRIFQDSLKDFITTGLYLNNSCY